MHKQILNWLLVSSGKQSSALWMFPWPDPAATYTWNFPLVDSNLWSGFDARNKSFLRLKLSDVLQHLQFVTSIKELNVGKR